MPEEVMIPIDEQKGTIVSLIYPYKIERHLINYNIASQVVPGYLMLGHLTPCCEAIQI